MASTADFRNGMTMELDGELFAVTYFQHVKPGKGGAFVRTKLKNVLTGAVIERTFRAGEKVDEVRLVRRPVQYSYTDGQFYYFMDSKTYEQIPLPAQTIGEDQLPVTVSPSQSRSRSSSSWRLPIRSPASRATPRRVARSGPSSRPAPSFRCRSSSMSAT